jgi:hypothetical protein
MSGELVQRRHEDTLRSGEQVAVAIAPATPAVSASIRPTAPPEARL